MDTVFKLFFPSGKTFLTWIFDDKQFINSFRVKDNQIIFFADISIIIAEYNSNADAESVLKNLRAAYRSRNCFTLPKSSEI